MRARQQLVETRSARRPYTPVSISVPSFNSGALLGLEWNMADTALTIMNPAYGLYRVFGGKGAVSSGTDPSSQRGGGGDPGVMEWAKLRAYEEAISRGHRADQALAATAQRRAELLAAPQPSYAPILTVLPSFTLGAGEDDELFVGCPPSEDNRS